jgi:hypothetical protein
MVVDERGPCKEQATAFFFGAGRNAETHVCGGPGFQWFGHYRILVDREVQRSLRRHGGAT